MMFFATQRIYIHDILTHAEYTKLSKKDILNSKLWGCPGLP